MGIVMENTIEAFCPKCKIITKQTPIDMPNVCIVVHGQKIPILSSLSICLECHSLIIPASMERFFTTYFAKTSRLGKFLE